MCRYLFLYFINKKIKKTFPFNFSYIFLNIYFHFLSDILKNGWFEFGPKIILIINILIYSKYVLWIVAVYHVALVNHTFIKKKKRKKMRKVEIKFHEKIAFHCRLFYFFFFTYFCWMFLSLLGLGLIEKLIGWKMDFRKIKKNGWKCWITIWWKTKTHLQFRHSSKLSFIQP